MPRYGAFTMDALAYTHLALAAESPQPTPPANPVGSSWDAAGWEEIFDSIDTPEDPEDTEVEVNPEE
jgi:hypothetical protein